MLVTNFVDSHDNLVMMQKLLMTGEYIENNGINYNILHL